MSAIPTSVCVFLTSEKIILVNRVKSIVLLFYEMNYKTSSHDNGAVVVSLGCALKKIYS